MSHQSKIRGIPKNWRRDCLAALWPCLFALPLQAWAFGSDTEEPDYFEELPVVLTASRLAQPKSEAPSAITVIDRKLIQASGFRTVPELMRFVPGMYVGFSDGNRPLVSRNGATDEFSRRMQVLVDGRSIYLPPFSSVSWADLPLSLEDVERIEVIRGPSAASHGTNSFYGVINIITRDAPGREGGRLVLSNGGGVNDQSVHLAQAGNRVDYRMTAGQRSDGGLNVALNDHNVTRFFNVRSNYHPNDADSLEVQFGAAHGAYGLGTAGRPEEAFRDVTSGNDFQQLSWLHVWPERDESKLTYYRISSQYADPYLCVQKSTCEGHNLPAIPVAQGFTQHQVNSQRQELEWQNTHQIRAGNRLVWGAAVRQDRAESPLLLAHPYTLNYLRAFAHNEWRVTPTVLLNVGTMLENDGMGNHSNSPRAALNYHLTPQQSLRVGVSTASRTPAMAEVYLDANSTFLGGGYIPPLTTVLPEKIVSREVGYLGEFSGLTLDARIYIDQVSDLIWWDKYAAGAPTYADSFKNMLSAEYKGVEVSAKRHWNEGRNFCVFNYAYQQASAGYSAYPTQYNNPNPHPDTYSYPTMTIGQFVAQEYQLNFLNLYPETVPKHSVSLLFSQNVGDSLQLSAGYYFRSLVRVINVASDIPPEDQMQRLDFRVAKTFGVAGQPGSGEASWVVQNALQNNYNMYGTVIQRAALTFDRRMYFTLAVNY